MYDNPADFALDTLIKLNEAYKMTSMHEKTLALVEQQSVVERRVEVFRCCGRVRVRSIAAEIYYVAQRTLKNSIRSPQLFLAQIMISIIMGLLVGIVFFDLKKTTEPGVQDRFGTLFFIVMNQIFSTLSSLEPLLKDRTLFIHVSYNTLYIIITSDLFYRNISVVTTGF
jgi:ATP-binding cassette, subfamily G (WHITE), member 2